MIHVDLDPPEHDAAIPFAHLPSRIERLEWKSDVWLAKRQQHTYAPLPAEDTSEIPVESLNVGLLRTFARSGSA